MLEFEKKSINKLYFGDKIVNKVYFGDVLIFDINKKYTDVKNLEVTE